MNKYKKVNGIISLSFIFALLRNIRRCTKKIWKVKKCNSGWGSTSHSSIAQMPNKLQASGRSRKKIKRIFLFDHVLFFSLVSASIPGCIILFVLGCLEFFVCFGCGRFHKKNLVKSLMFCQTSLDPPPVSCFYEY